jgi:hypothetical protein
MDPLDVFRVRSDGSFVWIGSADSLSRTHTQINSHKLKASDAFLIVDSQAHSRLTVRADELPPAKPFPKPITTPP